MSDCKYIQNNITKFLRSELEDLDKEKISEHLLKCVDCRLAYQEIRQQIQNSQ